MDRAFCNRATIRLELGDGTQELGELRQILLRSHDSETAYLAAYNAARIYELSKDTERALFYADKARERADKAERTDWLAYSHNLIANLHLEQSHFSDACSGYELALALSPADTSIGRALILDNLGYCRFVEGRLDEGFSMVFECLRTLRAQKCPQFEARPRLSLCYGYLELGRHDRALEHGLRALDLATRNDDDESIKNSLYLIGESYNQLGDTESARARFEELQGRFYPDAPHVPDLLLAIDVRPLLNLKASS